MIRYQCPKCETVMESPAEKGGDVETCPGCSQLITVPVPAERKPANQGQVVKAARKKGPNLGQGPTRRSTSSHARRAPQYRPLLNVANAGVVVGWIAITMSIALIVVGAVSFLTADQPSARDHGLADAMAAVSDRAQGIFFLYAGLGGLAGSFWLLLASYGALALRDLAQNSYRNTH